MPPAAPPRVSAAQALSRARWRERLMLVLHAEVGAALGIAFLVASFRIGIITRPSAAPPHVASSTRVGVTCPLHASPSTCDACMTAHCERECQACADSSDCLDLFLCATPCSDHRCENECASRFPQGKQLLQQFVGQTGCLAIFCRDACRSPAGSHD